MSQRRQHSKSGCASTSSMLLLLFYTSSLLFAMAIVDAARLPRSAPGLPPKIRKLNHSAATNSMECRALDGSWDGLGYQWFKDGTKLENKVHELQLDDNEFGTYYCVFSNIFGTARSQEVVIHPPQKVHCARKDKDEQTIRVSSGRDVIIPCDHMECPRRAGIKWYEFGSRNEIYYDSKHIKTATGSLLLFGVTQDVKYQCTIHNYTDNIWERGRVYDIQIGGSETSEVPACREDDTVRVPRGESVTSECLCEDEVTWYETGSSEPIEKGHTLTRNNVGSNSRVTSLSYECKGSNGIRLKQVTVIVEDQPTALEPMEEQLGVTYQGSASFSCRVGGTNTSEITWLYNNVKITTGSSQIPGVGTTTFNDHVLTLSEFDRTRPASGVVQCFVRNNLGSVVLSGRFTVSGDELPPKPQPEPTPIPPTTSTTEPTTSKQTDEPDGIVYVPYPSREPESSIGSPTGSNLNGKEMVSATVATDTETIPLKYIAITIGVMCVLLLIIIVIVLMVRQSKMREELKKYSDPNHSINNTQVALIQSEAYAPSRGSGAGSRQPEELIEEAMHLLVLAKQQGASTSVPQSEGSEVAGRRHMMERFINCQDSAYQSHSAPQSIISGRELTHSNSDNILGRTVPPAKQLPAFPHRHTSSESRLQTTQL